MNVILLRHGTRNFMTGDVGLNERGLREAQELSENSLLKKSTRLLSSPKKRAQMTIEPLSQKLGLEISIIEALDQTKSHENAAEFKSRIQSFINALKIHPEETVTICSHSDWLSVALEVIPTDALNIQHYMFACAEYLHFVIEDGVWKIQD